MCFGGPLSYVLDQRQRAAAELLRVVRPGGLLLVSAMSLAGAACNLVRRAALAILRDPVGQVLPVLRTGDLLGFPSRVPGWDHPAMHLYTSDELAGLFRPCEVLAVAGSNVTAVEGDPALEDVAADAEAWTTAVELERRLCRRPGLVETGSHIIVVARRP